MKKVAKIFRGAAYTLFRLELIIAFLCEIILTYVNIRPHGS